MSRIHRLALAGLFALLLMAGPATARTDSPVELDTGFGRHGVVDPGHSVPGFQQVEAMAVPGGTIYVAAEKEDEPGLVVIARYWRDGDPETSFGDHGYATLPEFGPVDTLATDPAGRLFAVSQNHSRITKFDGSGQPDSSFGGDGSVEMADFGLERLYLWSLISSPTGGLIAAGTTYGDKEMGVIKLRPDGSLDRSFNRSGFAEVRFGRYSDHGAEQVRAQGDGKLVVAGYAGSSPAIARLMPNGSLDESFGGDGKVIAPPWVRGRITALTVRRDGTILAGATGRIEPEIGLRALLLRYSPDGKLDRHFGAVAAPGSRSNPGVIPVTVMQTRHHIFMAIRSPALGSKEPAIRAFRLDGRPLRFGRVPGLPQGLFSIDAAPQPREPRMILAYTPPHESYQGVVRVKRFLLR
jgi:uncharacterized delta-60 repeat protein